MMRVDYNKISIFFVGKFENSPQSTFFLVGKFENSTKSALFLLERSKIQQNHSCIQTKTENKMSSLSLIKAVNTTSRQERIRSKEKIISFSYL
jgi:hypothetical protein